MVERKEGEIKPEPIRFDNVVMTVEGRSLRGVNIRPTAIGERNKEMLGDKFFVTTVDTVDGFEIELIINLKTLAEIIHGREISLEGGFHLKDLSFAEYWDRYLDKVED